MYAQNTKLLKKIMVGYALTFMVVSLTDSLTMIADGMTISRGLGATALAAIGLADPSYKIVSLFSGVLAVGLQSLCAQAMGSGDREKANRIFSAALVVTAAITVLLTVSGFACTDMLCVLFGAEKHSDIYLQLYDYLRGWFTGIPGYILFYVLSPLATLDGNKQILTVSTLIQSAVNIAGDILSVFVLGAGTYGVGLSTGIAYNISAMVLMLNFVRKQSVFRPFSASPEFRTLPKVLNIGLPYFTELCCRVLAPLLINRTILAVGGSLAMSAVSVKSSMIGFCLIIGNGVAASVGLVTQVLHSEKDAKALRGTVKSGLVLLIKFDAPFSALLFLFAGAVAGLFLPAGTEEWTLAVQVVRCLAVSLLLHGCNRIIIQYLQGARKMLPVHLMTAFHRIVALTVFTVLLGYSFGTAGLFAAIPVSEGAVLLGYIAVVLLKNRGRDFWNSVLMLPDGFGYNDDNSRAFSIYSVEEAVSVSKQIEDFLEQHQVDKRTSFFSGLCMEELATNVILHGFTKNNDKHYCDIKVMIDPDGIVLRIRDNCPYFDIRERYNSLSEEDANASIGIRLIYAVAKDVKYINVLKTNTIIIQMETNNL